MYHLKTRPLPSLPHLLQYDLRHGGEGLADVDVGLGAGLHEGNVLAVGQTLAVCRLHHTLGVKVTFVA